MTNVSLVLLDLPVVTTRGRTVPKLGNKELSLFWEEQAAAIYRPEEKIGSLALTYRRPSFKVLDQAINSSTLYKNNLLSAVVHIVTDADTIRQNQKIFRRLSVRLPHHKIIYHIKYELSVPKKDILQQYNLRGTVGTVGSKKHLMEGVVTRSGLSSRGIEDGILSNLTYILNSDPIEAEDLVITTIENFRDYYPAARDINEVIGQYSGIVITNHNSSYSMLGAQDEDKIIRQLNNWLERFIDEYESGVNENIVLFLDHKIVDDKSNYTDLIRYLTNNNVSTMMFGWPTQVGTVLHPVGFTNNVRRRYMDSVSEKFSDRDIIEGWRYHHEVSKVMPRLTGWVKRFGYSH